MKPIAYEELSPELKDRFTMGGKIPVKPWYLDSTCYSEQHYPSSRIVSMIQQAGGTPTSKGSPFFTKYPETTEALYRALTVYPISGKTVGVMGSTGPDFESICLAFGAAPIVVEYNKITTDHPDVKYMTVEEYDSNPRLFDVIFSISSYEHDGLGRFGDPINPDGDLEAMKRTKQMLAPGGLLYLAVPYNPTGDDLLEFNAARVYGNIRFPKLIEGWEELARFIPIAPIDGTPRRTIDMCGTAPRRPGTWDQPVFVLKNI